MARMSTITLKVNGRAHAVDVEPSTPLLYVLRNDLGLHGPRFGCGLGQCGACAVIINGVAVRSCVTPCSAVRAEVTTLEGLSARWAQQNGLSVADLARRCREERRGRKTCRSETRREGRWTGHRRSIGRLDIR